jgi:hypothetical protein
MAVEAGHPVGAMSLLIVPPIYENTLIIGTIVLDSGSDNTVVHCWRSRLSVSSSALTADFGKGF